MTEKLLNNIQEKKIQFDENYEIIKNNINKAYENRKVENGKVTLLAATKTVETEVINYAINKGLKFIGENKVQEFCGKYEELNKTVHRHFIGHLQTNKVKQIVDKVEMIESVDSVKLAKEIAKQSLKINKTMDILLEVNIGHEENKSGFYEQDVENAIKEISKIKGISIKGLMSIPPVCSENDSVRKYFQKLYKLFIDIKNKNIDNSSMIYLSMGMSSDYEIAIEEGANLVRIGTSLFGKRNYNI